MNIYDHQPLKIVLPSEYIPDGATVTKVSGQKKYTLRRVVKIYGLQLGPTCEVNSVTAAEGQCFIVSSTGDANVVEGSTELMWHVDSNSLCAKLTEDLYT